MKPSGVAVIGDIPIHWDAKPIRLLGRILKGVGGSKEDCVEEGIPCVRYGDLYTTHRETIEEARTYLSADRAPAYTPIRHGDLLFAASGEKLEEIGKSAVNLIDGEARCGGDMIILRPNVAMVPRFLGYAADAAPSVAQKTTMGRGTTVKHIYPDELRNLTIALPPLDEQACIADFLDDKTARIDSLIAKQKQLLALLAEKRQGLITQAVTKGLDASAPMKDSGIGWVAKFPTHWKALQIKRFARPGLRTFTDGDWIESPYITDQGVRLLQTGNVGIGYFKEQGGRFVSDATFAELRCTLLEAGDVLICRLDGPVGRACIAPDLGVRMITSVDNAILKVGTEHDARFVVYALTCPRYLEWVQALCRVGGGFRFRISRTMLGDFPLPAPPRDEQRTIADHLDRATATIRAAEVRIQSHIEKLGEYRQALIAAAVTGQLDVAAPLHAARNNASRHVEAEVA